jgi:diguanylate cyclase
VTSSKRTPSPQVLDPTLGLKLAVLTLLVFAVWVGTGVGGKNVVSYVDDLVTAAAALASTAACVRAATTNGGRRRLFWALLAAATTAWSLGEVLWAVYDLILRTAVPVPSWADLGYLSALPLAAAALLVHPALRGRSTGKVRVLLDALALASALFLLSWTLLLGPLWHSADLSTLGGLVALAYPVGDLTIVFLIVLAIRGSAQRTRPDLWLLLAGLLAISCSDAIYGYLTEVKQYSTGNLIDIGWVIGYLAIALAARSTHAQEDIEMRPAVPRLSQAAIVVPFLPLLAALGFTALRAELGHRLDHTGVATAFTLVAVVLARQALLVADLRPRHDRHPAIGDRLLAAVGTTARPTRRRG